MQELVAELANVSREIAEEALLEHKEVWLAVDALLQKPRVSGDKYIPAKPIVDSGLTMEQRNLCERGRWLQDKVNVVFSAAHSKVRPLPDDLPPAPATSPVPPSEAESLVLVPTAESPPDAPVKIPPPELKSSSPQ